MQQSPRLGSYSHPPSLAVEFGDRRRVLSLFGDNASLSKWVDQLAAVTTAHGFAHWGAQGKIYRGWAKVQNGDVAEGMSLLHSGSTAYRTTGAQGNMPYHIALPGRGM